MRERGDDKHNGGGEPGPHDQCGPARATRTGCSTNLRYATVKPGKAENGHQGHQSAAKTIKLKAGQYQARQPPGIQCASGPGQYTAQAITPPA